jgi:UDP-3-O-[3-hydroxymyristoyl] glucosamine N-acyltransferase
MDCGPTTASGWTRAVGATRADGSIGIPLYHTSVLVRDIAAILGADYEGDGEREITTAAPLESAGPHDLSFISGGKAVEAGLATESGCLIVMLDYPAPPHQTVIRTDKPRAAFAMVLGHLYARPEAPAGVHPSAVVEPGAQIPANCSVGPHVAIGEAAVLGEGTIVGAGSVIGARVRIGSGSLLHARVTIYDDVSIGARAVLHSGCVLGADGFGFALAGNRYQKFPQVGRVEIGDDVEIGANSCVDRAALGVTTIGDGTKLDNMVHIGHNCSIGRHVVIAAQTGLSGAVVVEDYAVIGGQVGIGDKARIESRAVLGSGSGVLTSKIVRSGQTVWGTPARPLKQHLQQLANLSRIEQIRTDIAELKSRLK